MFSLKNNLRIYALLTGSGVGTKPLQSLLDGHPEIIMIPAYPLVYFYPHWQTWTKTIKPWNWDNIIEIFLEKHASVIDSRKIPGHNGLTSLGGGANDYIKIDRAIFINSLKEILNGEEITSKNFILAIHLAYARSTNVNINKAKIIVYHLHNVQYLNYFISDFPDGKVIAMSRDPRSNINRRIIATRNINDSKLNATDSILYEKYIYKDICRYLYFDTNELLDEAPVEKIIIVKFEEMYFNLDNQMKRLSEWLDIEFDDKLLQMTFGGMKWWGDKIYDMDKMNVISSRVVSKQWKDELPWKEWFIIEGLSYHLMVKYGYSLEKYKKDNLLNRMILIVLILFPSRYEIKTILKYISIKNYLNFTKKSFQESSPFWELKDYTWNATYLYKWTYIYLKLWNVPLYKRLLIDMQKTNSNNKLRYFFLRALYIFVLNIKYMFSIASYPITIFKRIILMYRSLNKRIKLAKKLPAAL